MADVSIMVEALSLALAHPEGLPLLSSKQQPGLFPASAPGKAAATEARAGNFLRVLRTETRGRSSVELLVLADAGLAWLQARRDPRPALQALAEALASHQQQFASLASHFGQQQEKLADLLEVIRAALALVAQPAPAPMPTASPEPAAGPSLSEVALRHLRAWRDAGHLGDCPMHVLWRELSSSGASIGEFHDALRQLSQSHRIYLHPWTGPLYELPEPALALLVGHEIAYYVSLRD